MEILPLTPSTLLLLPLRLYPFTSTALFYDNNYSMHRVQTEKTSKNFELQRLYGTGKRYDQETHFCAWWEIFQGTWDQPIQRKNTEIFKWFLASKLFGARIGTNIAIKTYKGFEKRGVVSPERILETGWDGLVRILDDGGYVRYDFSTATKLLEIMEDLKRDYNGDLNRLQQKAGDEKDLEYRLKSLGKGIGAVTVNIFLRELRSV